MKTSPPSGVLEVWTIPLDATPENVFRPEKLLDNDDLEEMRRFRDSSAHTRFALRRAARRIILGRRVGIPPENLRFEKSAEGKPALAGFPDVAFSASSSGDFAVLAVSTGGPVGIDIEKIRPVPDAVSIAREFFNADENHLLSKIPPEKREAEFLRVWVSKEARIKADGRGWKKATALDKFILAEFVPAEGYVGMIATEKATNIQKHELRISDC